MAYNQKKIKAQILKELRENRNLEAVIRKLGVVDRSTIYRWRDDDPKFANGIVESKQIGTDKFAERAELGLMNEVFSGNLRAMIYTLEHHHQDYTPRHRAPAQLPKVDKENLPQPILGGRSNLEIFDETIEKPIPGVPIWNKYNHPGA